MTASLSLSLSLSTLCSLLASQEFNLQRFYNVYNEKVESGWSCSKLSASILSLYFFIAVQIAQVAEPIWIALSGQLGQSGSNKEIQPSVNVSGMGYMTKESKYKYLSEPILYLLLPGTNFMEVGIVQEWSREVSLL